MAVFVIAVGVIAAARINPTSYKGAAITKNRLTATRIARNVIDQVRSLPFHSAPANPEAVNRLRMQQQVLRSAQMRIETTLRFGEGTMLQGGADAQHFLQQFQAEFDAFQTQFKNAAVDGSAPTLSAQELSGIRSADLATFQMLEARLLEETQKAEMQLSLKAQKLSQAGTGDLDPKQFQPPVPPETVEGRPAGTTFKVTKVHVSVAGDEAPAGTVTVTVEWQDVGGKTDAGAKSLTLSSGVLREP